MDKTKFDFPVRIETERLYLRAYTAGDGRMLYAAGERNHQLLTEFDSDNILLHLKNTEHAETVIKELTTDWAARNSFFIGIFEKATDTWVGQVYLAPTNWDLPEFTIGYMADVDFGGKGYISEAVTGVLGVLFVDLGVHRVKSECNENNIRSWRLLERCGFKREGHLRENKRSDDGSFHGDFLYGLLQQEYLG